MASSLTRSVLAHYVPAEQWHCCVLASILTGFSSWAVGSQTPCSTICMSRLHQSCKILQPACLMAVTTVSAQVNTMSRFHQQNTLLPNFSHPDFVFPTPTCWLPRFPTHVVFSGFEIFGFPIFPHIRVTPEYLFPNIFPNPPTILPPKRGINVQRISSAKNISSGMLVGGRCNGT